MNFENLTDEQKNKVCACKTPEEVLELTKEEGYELSDDELAAISGGESWAAGQEDHLCPHCGSHDTTPYWFMGKKRCTCNNCGKDFPLPND